MRQLLVHGAPAPLAVLPSGMGIWPKGDLLKIMKKKIIALALAVLMLLGLFACGSGSAEESAGGDPAVSESVSATDPGETENQDPGKDPDAGKNDGEDKGPDKAEDGVLEPLEWLKGFDDDGTMFIYAKEYVNGALTYADGKEATASMWVSEDKDGFAVHLYNESDNIIYNGDDTSLDVPSRIVWVQENGNPFEREFTCTMKTGDKLIRFPGSATGYMQSTFSGGQSDDGTLVFDVPGIGEFVFPLPGGGDYPEILALASRSFYVPTWTTEFYEGSGPNPELVEWLDALEKKIMDRLEAMERKGAKLELTVLLAGGPDLADIVYGGGEDLRPDYARLEVMGDGLILNNDHIYWKNCKDRIDAAVAKHGIGSSYDIIDDFLNLFF